jgi:hypothetical protein
LCLLLPLVQPDYAHYFRRFVLLLLPTSAPIFQVGYKEGFLSIFSRYSPQPVHRIRVQFRIDFQPAPTLLELNQDFTGHEPYSRKITKYWVERLEA